MKHPKKRYRRFIRMLDTIVKSRLVKMAEAEGMKKILEMARESEIRTESDTDPGETNPDDGTDAEEIIEEEAIHPLKGVIERLKEQQGEPSEMTEGEGEEKMLEMPDEQQGDPSGMAEAGGGRNDPGDAWGI